MTDGFGRTIDYLRISLTDKCNLRCLYCMPQEGIKHLSHDEILSFEEITEIVSLLAEEGLKKIRLTGGEPLVRKNMPLLVKKLSEIKGIEKICLTSNGLLLEEYADDLKKAGLTGLNISLDSLDDKIFSYLSGLSASHFENGPAKVLSAVRKALACGFKVKINCVPCKNLNDGQNQLEKIALLSKEFPLDVRFIELMPLGCGKNFEGLPSDSLLYRLEKSFGRAEPVSFTSSSPARYFHFKDFKGNTGFISPMSHAFCKDCNRIRLTSDGKLKLCLCYSRGIDLKKFLRKGESKDRLKKVIENALKEKPLRHSFEAYEEKDKIVELEKMRMVQIGG